MEISFDGKQLQKENAKHNALPYLMACFGQDVFDHPDLLFIKLAEAVMKDPDGEKIMQEFAESVTTPDDLESLVNL